ncbi:precorrin-2 dehydrogenase/sirohydrochlorin ferrochelatase family protein [Konateibacter massiliensis]|uniref:precorrin-2 dehydrogenase/sirohydrochlorin ferrochelatase family protein n=1 Tax=Konateibacter massiliensis TaxID=2002841 RepID=UPI000C14569E|nr:bifunctional precorrin-2 dehydrogenase/sirohydrochlorin ferrochelatase [Konateibacter massiliensis]
MSELKFPLFIPLEQKKIMIFGAGKVAYRRINTLLLFHADITVVAPKVYRELESLIADNKIQWIPNSYPAHGIEEDAFLVLAATDDEAINEKIYKECKRLHILGNNAGNQKQCDFFFPAVVTTEDVSIGIAGDGTNHKKVREIAEKIRKERESNA